MRATTTTTGGSRSSHLGGWLALDGQAAERVSSSPFQNRSRPRSTITSNRRHQGSSALQHVRLGRRGRRTIIPTSFALAAPPSGGGGQVRVQGYDAPHHVGDQRYRVRRCGHEIADPPAPSAHTRAYLQYAPGSSCARVVKSQPPTLTLSVVGGSSVSCGGRMESRKRYREVDGSRRRKCRCRITSVRAGVSWLESGAAV